MVCIFFVPIFRKLKVYTAYEFLEQRFDLKTRLLTSFLFMLSRSLSTGISIIAPALVLHSMLGWDMTITNIFMGAAIALYDQWRSESCGLHTAIAVHYYLRRYVCGGLCGAIKLLPDGVGVSEALHISGKSGKLNVFTSGFTENGFDWKDRFNIWSGLIGGFFFYT